MAPVAQNERVVTTPDGRRLRVVEGGRRDGRPVLFHHGLPGSGDLYGPHARDAEEKGIRLIGYDRPGYGDSTRHAGYRIADSAADVRAIADALDIRQLAAWGMSGGGPHALACAALLPDLVVAAGTFASMAPYGAPGLDFFAGMGQANADDIKLTLADEAAALARLPEDRESVLALTPETLQKGMETPVSDADAAARNAEFAEWIVGGMHAGLRHSGEGWWDDSLAGLKPWGFDVDSIHVPVQLWHGRQDRLVPFGHGEWLAGHIPAVEAHLTQQDGHGTVVQYHVPELHAWLLDHFE